MIHSSKIDDGPFLGVHIKGGYIYIYTYIYIDIDVDTDTDS